MVPWGCGRKARAHIIESLITTVVLAQMRNRVGGRLRLRLGLNSVGKIISTILISAVRLNVRLLTWFFMVDFLLLPAINIAVTGVLLMSARRFERYRRKVVIVVDNGSELILVDRL